MALVFVASACVPPPPPPPAPPPPAAAEVSSSYSDLGFTPLEDSPLVSAAQPDGKVVVAARKDNPGGQFILKRVRADGTVDASFGTGGTLSLPAPDDSELIDLLVDSSGRILLIAGILPDAAPPWPYLVRLLASGALDTSFGDSGVVHPEDAGFLPTDSVEASSGRYAVAGMAVDRDTGIPHSAVAMMGDDGNLVPSFGDDGLRILQPNGFATAVARSSNGRLLVAGSTFSAEEDLPGDAFLLSLPTDGNGPAGGGSTDVVMATGIEVDTAGRVLVAGLTEDYLGTITRFPASLVTSGGALVADPGFGTGGSTHLDPSPNTASVFRSIDLIDSGDILVSAWRGEKEGDDTALREILLRLDADGEIDTRLGDGGVVATGLHNPSEFIFHSVVAVHGEAIWVPGAARDGVPGGWLGRFVLPDPPPAPMCPGGPVRVTPENAVGASIARWVCAMELVGTIWRSEGIIVLIPRGFFDCPRFPQTFWFDPRAEFGFFLLQAKCGYQPRFQPAWGKPWLSWVPSVI